MSAIEPRPWPPPRSTAARDGEAVGVDPFPGAVAAEEQLWEARTR